MLAYNHPFNVWLRHSGILEADLLNADESGYDGRLAPDGSLIRPDPSGQPVVSPPPPGKAGLVRRRRYYTVHCDRAERAFGFLKRALTDSRSRYTWDHRTFGPSSGDGVTDLKYLQGLVLDSRKIITKLDALIEMTEEVNRDHERDEAFKQAENARLNRQAETIHAVNLITI